MSPRDEILRNGYYSTITTTTIVTIISTMPLLLLQVDNQMPPSRRHMQHLSRPANPLNAPLHPPRRTMEAHKPLRNAKRRRYLAVIGRDIDSWWRWQCWTCTCACACACTGIGIGTSGIAWKHDPVLRAAQDGVPGAGGVGVLVEGAAAARGADD
ncbi:ctr copper transporter [Histoplasma capsulatum G186AR]|uniref:Ctr copper transporter n=1 Tax=Ajellomyces capsulatus TaxID=5037 RepID=A0A8H7YCN5_AJECA|nr:ctr copper transporter [Histoplasma capsulatum]QSS71186.1 ctr copper transporter [Histoplasma capsulatum G186AR]